MILPFDNVNLLEKKKITERSQLIQKIFRKFKSFQNFRATLEEVVHFVLLFVLLFYSAKCIFSLYFLGSFLLHIL